MTQKNSQESGPGRKHLSNALELVGKHKPDICVVDDQISFDGKKYQIASWEFHDDYVISVCYEDAGYKHQYEMVEVI